MEQFTVAESTVVEDGVYKTSCAYLTFTSFDAAIKD
jgi:hypothetical protein